MLRKALDCGRLRFGTDIAEAAVFGDVHFVCVGTPQAKDSPAADLTYVYQAVSELAQHLQRRLPGRWQVHRAGRYRGRLTQLLQDYRALRQRCRACLEPGVPA